MLTSLTVAATTLIKDWQARLADLPAAKAAIAAERVARDAVIAHVFKDAPVGTSTFDLTEGWAIKFCRSLDYKLDTSPVDPADPAGKTKLDAALDALEASGNDGSFIVERLIRWKPELSVSEYKKLTPDQRAIIDAVLTTKDATPELAMVPPKVQK